MGEIWVTNAARGTHELVSDKGGISAMLHLQPSPKGHVFAVYVADRGRSHVLRLVDTIPWTAGLAWAKEVASRRSGEELADQGTTPEPTHGHPVQHSGAQRSP